MKYTAQRLSQAGEVQRHWSAHQEAAAAELRLKKAIQALRLQILDQMEILHFQQKVRLGGTWIQMVILFPLQMMHMI